MYMFNKNLLDTIGERVNLGTTSAKRIRVSHWTDLDFMDHVVSIN